MRPPWQSGGARWVRPLLPLAERAYRAAIRARRLTYQLHLRRITRVPVPVLCVGNLTIGGTGKTPAVIAVCRRLSEWGRRPAVVSRGHRGDKSTTEILRVDASNSDWQRVGDEPLMIARMLRDVPVFVGADRVAAARRAVEEAGPDVIVLDDGFQHWRLRRDLDIVLLDGDDPFGNGHLLPRGPMREPLAALRRADIVVLTKVNLATEAGIWAQRLGNRLHAPVVQAIHRPVRIWDLSRGEALDLSALRGKRVVGACGLARNETFHALLRSLGAQVEAVLDFDDHQVYGAAQWQTIRHVLRESEAEALVTTAKDAVKWTDREIDGLRVWVLEIAFELSVGPERFWNAVRHALR